MLKKIYGVHDWIRAIGIIAVLTFMVGLCTVQIILRYFTGAGLKPFPWGDELIRLSSMWVAFLAASLGAKEEAHLSVTIILEKYFSPKLMKIMQKLATIIVILTLVYLIYFGFERTVANLHTSLQNINMSIAWFYAAVPIGCFYLLIDYLLILIFGRHPFSDKRINSEKKLGEEK